MLFYGAFTCFYNAFTIIIVPECSTNINSFIYINLLWGVIIPILWMDSKVTGSLMSKVSTNFGCPIWDTNGLIFPRALYVTILCSEHCSPPSALQPCCFLFLYLLLAAWATLIAQERQSPCFVLQWLALQWSLVAGGVHFSGKSSLALGWTVLSHSVGMGHPVTSRRCEGLMPAQWSQTLENLAA